MILKFVSLNVVQNIFVTGIAICTVPVLYCERLSSQNVYVVCFKNNSYQNVKLTVSSRCCSWFWFCFGFWVSDFYRRSRLWFLRVEQQTTTNKQTTKWLESI